MGAKIYRGQAFVPTLSAAEIAARTELQKKYDDPKAVPIEVFFKLEGIRDPARQAAMKAFTKVRKATPLDWALLFEKF